MAIYLEAIEGPYEGQTYHLRDGIEIGRVRGQILLKKDTKVSSFHAAVVKDASGNLAIVDQGSSNGLKIDGQKLKRLVLTAGIEFYIGRTLFRVVDKSDAAVAGVDNPVEKNWEQVLAEDVPTIAINRVVPKVSVKSFKFPVRLKFIEGIQADEALWLGFGPRDFGSDNMDVELRESISPANAFTIAPLAETAVLTTDFPKMVQVNDQSDIRHELKEGDLIRIGDTLIQVGFEKL